MHCGDECVCASAEVEIEMQLRADLDLMVPLSSVTRARIHAGTPTSIEMAARAGFLSEGIGAAPFDLPSDDAPEPLQLRTRKTDRLDGSPVSAERPDHE